MKSDILIIGSGLAGMATALYLAELRPESQIVMVSKAKKDESNTKYAQGGIAGVVETKIDSFEQHIEDTMKAGHYLSSRKIVELVVKSAPDAIKDLERWGVNFDYEKEGTYELGLEGGHSKHRILHHKDSTGKEIYDKLNKQVQLNSSIQLINNCTALELNTNQGNQIEGALFLNLENNKFFNISAQKTILASGGIGRIFGHTSNPEVATADGLAMAIRAGAELSNMHFVQFHPTLFFKANKEKSFLISEALRGFGAYLVNKDGKRFMQNYDDRAELSPRDVVCKAIFKELKQRKESNVFLDCRHLNPEEIKRKFPFIAKKCEEEGLDINKDLIPVVPAAHYHCGGIAVNQYGQSNLENLYAIGEIAETGLHGKNRLASNSLLEAVVFAKKAALNMVQEIEVIESKEQSDIEFIELSSKVQSNKKAEEYLTALQSEMQKMITVSRDKSSLCKIQNQIVSLQKNFENDFPITTSSLKLTEISNMLLVAEKIVNSAINDV